MRGTTTAQPGNATMTQYFPTKAFAEAFTPATLQALAEKSVASSKALFDKASAVAAGGARGLTDVADTAWSGTKVLNEKIAQNVAANVSSAFAAAETMASAKSLAEVVTIQAEYVKEAAARAEAQTKEFVDLSTRAAHYVLEKARAVSQSLTPSG
jgi:hypothetical protein